MRTATGIRFRTHATAAVLYLAATLAAAGCAARANGPVIVYLVSREHVTIVTSTPRGPVYTVRQRSGETVVEALSLPQLRSRHPRLYREIAPTLAAHGHVDDDEIPLIDASLGGEDAQPEPPAPALGDPAAGA